MSWAKKLESARSLLFAVAILAVAVAAMWIGAQFNTAEASVSAAVSDDGAGTTFPGSGVGAIPDRGATGCGPPAGPNLDVTFNVSGLTGTVNDVNVSLTGTHSWVGDLGATLIAPNNTSHVLFSRTGATTATSCGDSSDLGGTYTFDDQASNTNWWQAAATAGSTSPVPVGAYRTTQAGPQATANNSPETSLNTAFNGVSPNGTWTLRINDFGGGDTGSISAANLTITTAGGPGGAPDPFLNFADGATGPKLTDFAVFTFPTTGGTVRWLIARNDNPTPTNGFVIDYGWGNSATDLVPNFGNYSGSALTDFNLYRNNSGSPANTYMISENPNIGTQKFVQWGSSTSDTIGAEGDYSGDGLMDPTVVRTESGAFRWYVLNSGTNTLTTFIFGASATDIALPGADYTGDGKDDPTVARVGASGLITWFVGTTGGTVLSATDWGTFNTDFIVPGGDFDGDNKADLAVWRGFGTGTNGVWYIRTAAGSTISVPWGTPGASGTRDIALRAGDYDGDGKDDISVYRPGTRQFIIRRSSDNGTIIQGWGISGNTNIPLASFGTF